MFLENSNTNDVIAQIKGMTLTKHETLLILLGEEGDYDLQVLVKKLNELNVTFFGGIFPGIIHGANKYSNGCLIKTLPTICQPVVVTGLDNGNLTYDQFDDLDAGNEKELTILTFVDGLTAHIPDYLQFLYERFGKTVSFLGAGAGSLTLVQKPCVFTNKGVFQDAGIFMVIDMKIGLGVQHGWQKLVGPLVATRTDKNIIYELNWENAFEAYQEVINQDSTTPISKDNFFDIAKGYPFGIFKEFGEDIVRDPISVGEQGELICVGDVPENTVLYILKGENEMLIQSAEVATQQSITETKNDIQHTLIVDCISRTLFLEKDFHKELEMINNTIKVKNKEAQPHGVLSLGEISSYGEGYIEFYNKTLVVGALYN